MKTKRIILTILLIVWMVIIFIFSNQDATKSESTSDKVASDVIDTVTEVTKQEITKQEKEELIDDSRFVVRKLAHFTLYFVLGILSYLTLTSYNVNHAVLYSIVFCILYAISDEVHQIFLDGRTFKILDILIDTTGSFFGAIITNFIYRKGRCRK